MCAHTPSLHTLFHKQHNLWVTAARTRCRDEGWRGGQHGHPQECDGLHHLGKAHAAQDDGRKFQHEALAWADGISGRAHAGREALARDVPQLGADARMHESTKGVSRDARALLGSQSHSPGQQGRATQAVMCKARGSQLWKTPTCTHKIRDKIFKGGLWCPSGSQLGCCATSSMHRQQVCKGFRAACQKRTACGRKGVSELQKDQGMQGSANQKTHLMWGKGVPGRGVQVSELESLHC